MADRPTPSTTAVAIASALVAGVIGFFIGQGSSLGLFESGGSPSTARKSWPNSYDVKVHADSSDEEGSEEELVGDLSDFSDNTEEVKLVLVVRTDLGMGKGTRRRADTARRVSIYPKILSLRLGPLRHMLTILAGKIAAQASHATLACYKYMISRAPDSPILKRWERGGQAKVAVQVKSEDELLVLQAQAISLGLCAQVIRDAGRTQIAAGSVTVLGVLGPKSVVDQVTGQLKLL